LTETSAAAQLAATDLADLRAIAERATVADVDVALRSPRRSLAHLAALVSAAGAERLAEMEAMAHTATARRFGRAVRLFAPLYLSNECVSQCTYCGFASDNQIARRTLTSAEVLHEARALRARGMRHLLLVSGEHARIVSPDYLVDCISILAPEVPSISVEVQTWATAVYRRLVGAGCEGLVVYQETYDRATYAAVHQRGRKRDYDRRLEAPDRGAAAGMRQLGIGVLLGLHHDWRADVLAMAAHARALTKRWWRCEVSVSLPRLRPAAGGYEPEVPVGDDDFTQALCALRLVLPDVGISLSTRERPELRDTLIRLGVTRMSAGSSTEPGGYGDPGEAEPQFEVSDTRTPADVAAMLSRSGYDPVWIDTIGARQPAPVRSGTSGPPGEAPLTGP